MTLGELAARHHAPTVAWVTGRVQRRHGLQWETARDAARDAVQDAWTVLAARGLRPGDRMPGLLMRIALRAWGESVRRREVERRARWAGDVHAEMGWGAALTPAGVEAVRELEGAGRCEGCGTLLEPSRTNPGRRRWCSKGCRTRTVRKAKRAAVKRPAVKQAMSEATRSEAIKA